MSVQAHDACMAELLSRGNKAQLKHVEITNDSSWPHVPSNPVLHKFPKEELLSDIKAGVPLRHVEPEEVHDGSRPVVEDIVLHVNNRAEHLAEIRARGAHHAAMEEFKDVVANDFKEGGPPLRHVATVDKTHVDTSDVVVRKWDKQAFLDEVRAPHWLNTVDEADRQDGRGAGAGATATASHLLGSIAEHRSGGGSAGSSSDGGRAELGGGLNAGAAHSALMHEVVRAHEHSPLHHAAQAADRSAPAVTKTAAMRVVAGAQERAL